jgi:hypothetical protein
MGRPRKEVNYEQLEALAAMQATGEEIASVLGISHREFESRRAGKSPVDRKFREVFLAGRGKGKLSLRKTMWEQSKQFPNMSIFLSKQYLNMRDTFEEVGPNRDQNSLWQLAELLNKRGPTLPVIRSSKDKLAGPSDEEAADD